MSLLHIEGAAQAQSAAASCATPVNNPLLLDARSAAALIGVSRSAWWVYHNAGKCPKPIQLGGRTLWRADELRAWVAVGCPPRTKWSYRTPVTHL